MYPEHVYEAELIRVIDADTIVLDVDAGFSIWSRRMRLRLYGINAPEMNTEAGRAATLFVMNWMTRHPKLVVRTIKDKDGRDKSDSFGRYLAEVYAFGPDQKSLNDLLVEVGYAVKYIP